MFTSYMNWQAIRFSHMPPNKFHTLQTKFAVEISFIAAKSLRIRRNFYTAIGSNLCLVCRDTNDTCTVHRHCRLSWHNKINCCKINTEFKYLPASALFLWCL